MGGKVGSIIHRASGFQPSHQSSLTPHKPPHCVMAAKTQYRLLSASPYLTFSYLTLTLDNTNLLLPSIHLALLTPGCPALTLAPLTRSAIKLLHVAPRDELDGKCQTVDRVRGMLPKLPELPPIPIRNSDRHAVESLI